MSAEAESNKADAGAETAQQSQNKPSGKKDWKAPSLEDVSGEVMAQPYIRFT